MDRISILSSRVQDGVCDCCNGEDETDLACDDRCATIRMEHDKQEKMYVWSTSEAAFCG